jgi:hypothetical protein
MIKKVILGIFVFVSLFVEPNDIQNLANTIQIKLSNDGLSKPVPLTTLDAPEWKKP